GAAGAIGVPKAASYPGKSTHDARRSDLTDRVVIRVGDIDIARVIHCYAGWPIEARAAAGAIGTAFDANQTGQCAHYAGRSDLADRVVNRVRHVNIARVIRCHAVWQVEARGAAGAIGAATT